MSRWHGYVQASLDQKVRYMLMKWPGYCGEKMWVVETGSVLLPVLALFVKAFASLIFSQQSPLLTSSVSCIGSLSPVANVDGAGQFFCLTRYWNSPFCKSKRRGWAFRRNMRMGKKVSRCLSWAVSFWSRCLWKWSPAVKAAMANVHSS